MPGSILSSTAYSVHMYRIPVKSLWPKMRRGGEIRKLSGPNYVRTRRPWDPVEHVIHDSTRVEADVAGLFRHTSNVIESRQEGTSWRR